MAQEKLELAALVPKPMLAITDIRTQEPRGGQDWICRRDALLQRLIHMLGHQVLGFKAQQ